MMNWIKQYQLFLFDFDGLLVNTEHIHFQAYIEMCARRGYHLDWNFVRYSQAAHHKATDLRDHIYAKFPALLAEEPNWTVLYKEKKQIFLDLLAKGKAHLMPGANELLIALQTAHIKRCVVTHSALELIALIRQQNPILDSIPYWITREDYTHPKPDPECYQVAIAKYALPQEKVIGFEDSPRGINALRGSSAKPILVCPSDSAYLSEMLQAKICFYPSLDAITDDNAP